MTNNGHVSQWPSYYRDIPRDRNLAYIELTDDTVYTLTTEDVEKIVIDSYKKLIEVGFELNLDIYIHKLFGRSGFLWIDEAIDSGASARIAQSSNVCTILSIKGEKNKIVKIISVVAWGENLPPTIHFIKALRAIFDKYGHGTYPSASSLGQAAMIDWHKQLGLKRFYRPSSMLRQKLFKYGSGGRVDDLDLYKEYSKKYTADICNSYASQAYSGVPIGKHETIRLIDWYTNDMSEIEEYSACFCQSRITIPEDLPIRKFSPFYIRREDGRLKWENRPGTYTGWYWSPMLRRCIEIGYKVEIAFCYCWKELNHFLKNWVVEVIGLREYFRNKYMYLEEEICKRIIVSAIGVFAMRDSEQTIITENNKQEGDIRFLDLQIEGLEPMATDYYVRTRHKPDSNNLTQVAYFIIMKNNIELYDRCIAEEMEGNIVIRTYFDSISTMYPPTQPTGKGIGEWKIK